MSKNTQPKRWQGAERMYGPLGGVLPVVVGFSSSRNQSKQKTNVFSSTFVDTRNCMQLKFTTDEFVCVHMCTYIRMYDYVCQLWHFLK